MSMFYDRKLCHVETPQGTTMTLGSVFIPFFLEMFLMNFMGTVNTFISRAAALAVMLLLLRLIPLNPDFGHASPARCLKMLRPVLKVGIPGAVSSLSYNISQIVHKPDTLADLGDTHGGCRQEFPRASNADAVQILEDLLLDQIDDPLAGHPLFMHIRQPDHFLVSQPDARKIMAVHHKIHPVFLRCYSNLPFPLPCRHPRRLSSQYIPAVPFLPLLPYRKFIFPEYPCNKRKNIIHLQI